MKDKIVKSMDIVSDMCWFSIYSVFSIDFLAESNLTTGSISIKTHHGVWHQFLYHPDKYRVN